MTSCDVSILRAPKSFLGHENSLPHIPTPTRPLFTWRLLNDISDPLKTFRVPALLWLLAWLLHSLYAWAIGHRPWHFTWS